MGRGGDSLCGAVQYRSRRAQKQARVENCMTGKVNKVRITERPEDAQRLSPQHGGQPFRAKDGTTAAVEKLLLATSIGKRS
jgi:hypothetical protein